MRTMLNLKKTFQLDVLSLVLACVISMLFTKGVVEFLSATSKKQDHQSAAFSPVQQNEFTEEELFYSADNLLESPLENHCIETGDHVAMLHDFRALRINALVGIELEKQVFRSNEWGLGKSYLDTLPSRWGPTVSIAHCKLII